MALSLFEDLADQNRPITESPKEIGYRRNRIFMDLSECGLLAAKAIDVVFYLVAQEKTPKEGYVYDLNFFKWMLNYDSNNHTHLKAVLREATRASIEGDASTATFEDWGAKPVLSAVRIRGGQLMFQVDNVIQKLVQDPAQSRVLSLRITNAFTSLYAHRLYLRLLDCLDEASPNGEQTTGYVPLAIVKDWLGCNIKFYNEFYEFRRGPLTTAVNQLNEHSNLQVQMKTKNVPGSKAVGFIRFDFTVDKSWQPRLESMAWTQELYEALQVDIGLSQADFERIRENRATYTDERIRRAIDYTRYMAKKTAIGSIPRYFMNALEKDFRVPGLALALEHEKAQETEAAQIREEVMKKTRARASSAPLAAIETEGALGLEALALLPITEQTAMLKAFLRLKAGELAAHSAGLARVGLSLDEALANNKFAMSFGAYLHQKAKLAAAKAEKAPRAKKAA